VLTNYKNDLSKAFTTEAEPSMVWFRNKKRDLEPKLGERWAEGLYPAGQTDEDPEVKKHREVGSDNTDIAVSAQWRHHLIHTCHAATCVLPKSVQAANGWSLHVGHSPTCVGPHNMHAQRRLLCFVPTPALMLLVGLCHLCCTARLHVAHTLGSACFTSTAKPTGVLAGHT
jgi:hypothetical protein